MGNLITFVNELEIVEDFSLGLNNLGGDSEVAGETRLSGIKFGGTGERDLLGSNGTNTGGGFSDLVVEDIEDITEVVVGEDDGGVSLKIRNDLIKVRPVDPSVVRLGEDGRVAPGGGCCFGGREVEVGDGGAWAPGAEAVSITRSLVLVGTVAFSRDGGWGLWNKRGAGGKNTMTKEVISQLYSIVLCK